MHCWLWMMIGFWAPTDGFARREKVVLSGLAVFFSAHPGFVASLALDACTLGWVKRGALSGLKNKAEMGRERRSWGQSFWEGRRSWGQSSWEGLLVASELSWVESGRSRRARGAGAQMGRAPVGPRRSASDPVKLIQRRPRGEALRSRSLPKPWRGTPARSNPRRCRRAILSCGIDVGPEEKRYELGPFPSPERAPLPRIAQGEVGERLASRRSPGSLPSAFAKS